MLLGLIVSLLFISAIDLAFNIGGPRWTAISAAILTVIGVLVGLGGWHAPFPEEDNAFIPISPLDQAMKLLYKRENNYLKDTSNQGTGTLLILTSKENEGVTIYLLPRDAYVKCEQASNKAADRAAKRDHHLDKKTETITAERFGTQVLYITYFRDLKPGRYNIWVGWNVQNPKERTVHVGKGTISERELDWKN